MPAQARALRGDWREIPLRDGCIDFAVGDGCYSTFADLRGPREMNREVRRVLRPGGMFSLRCFRRPDIGLSAAAVANLEAWRSVEASYFFPSLDELRALVAPFFELEACDVPGYAWGEQFPRLVMRRAR